jgi:hypothetical protein
MWPTVPGDRRKDYHMPVHPFRPGEGEEIPLTAEEAARVPIFQIYVEKTPTTGEILITGSGATANGRVELHYVHVPGNPVNVSEAIQAEPNRTFTHHKTFGVVQGTQEDAFADVYVAARDAASGAIDTKSVTAAYWISF